MDKEAVEHTHTMGYYTVIEKNEILSFATTWTDLDIIIILSEVKSDKDKHHTISLIYSEI